MKKSSKKICSLIIIFTIVFNFGFSYNEAFGSTTDSELIFGVLSDTHLRTYESKQDEKLRTAFRTIKSMENNLDAMVIAGDITDSGKLAEYKRFKTIYDEAFDRTVKKLFVMGNHDYLNGLAPEEARSRFKEQTDDLINEHKVIKGYHFISVNTESSETHGSFGEGVQKWLKEELNMAQEQDPKRPIFVIVHQHIKNTVYGSDVWGNDCLYPILKDYPQVVCFSGHSHNPLNDERSIYQKDFTCVGTGGFNDIGLEDTKINWKESSRTEFAQGLLVQVEKDNTVSITRLDFANGRIIKNKWVIKDPSNKSGFTYTDDRKNSRTNPYFKDGSIISVSQITKNSAEVSFSKAYHEDFVHSYKIEVLNKSTGKVEKRFLMFSDFFNMKQLDTLNIKISRLSKNTQYEVVIKAIESFGKESETSLTKAFTTF